MSGTEPIAGRPAPATASQSPRTESEGANAAADAASHDRLADLFTHQTDLAAFYRRVRSGPFYNLPPIERCGMWVRAIIHECCELEDELGWKPWKNPPDLERTREARLDETADILHFLLQLALDQGFSADDLYAAYVRKNAENRARQIEDPRYRQA